METPYENILWSWRRTLRPSSLNNLPLLHANPNSQNKSPLCCCEPLYWHCICQQSVFFPHCCLILARRLMKTRAKVLLRSHTHRKSTTILHFVISVLLSAIILVCIFRLCLVLGTPYPCADIICESAPHCGPPLVCSPPRFDFFGASGGTYGPCISMSPVEARSAATAILRARVTKIGNLVGLQLENPEN